MAETVNGITVKVSIQGTVVGSDGISQRVDISYEKTFTDGTGTNQCQNFWFDESRALNATNETLDLDGLTDFQGATMTPNAAVKVMFFQNASTTAAELLTLGGGDFASWVGDATDKVKVGPAGILLLVNPIDGYTITASTGDGLLVAHSGNSSYKAFLAVDNT